MTYTSIQTYGAGKQRAGEGGATVDVGAGQTATVKHLWGTGDIAIYAWGSAAGSTRWGQGYPSWWPTYPAPLATLTDVGDSYDITEHVIIEPVPGTGPAQFQIIKTLT